MSLKNVWFIRGLQGFHAVAVSSFFCSSVWLLSLSILGQHLSEQILPAIVLPIALLLLNIVATAISRTQPKPPRTSTWLRFMLVLAIVVYLLGSLFEPGPLGLRFVPSFGNLGPLFFALTLLFLTRSMDNAWRIRERLMQLVDGLPQVELLQRLQQEHTDILLGFEAVKRNNRVQIWLLSLYLVLVFIHAISGQASVAPALSFICGAGLILSTLIGLMLGNSYLDDHELLRHTSLLGVEQRVFRLLVSLIMILLAFATGALFASNEPLIPPELLASFFDWLASLFDDPATQTGMSQVSDFIREPRPSLPDISVEQVRAAQNFAQFFKTLFEILQIAVILLGAAALLWFITVPILRKGGLRSLIRDLRARAEAGLLVNIVDAVRRFFALLRDGIKSLFAKPQRFPKAELGESVDDMLDYYLGELRKRQAAAAELELVPIPGDFIAGFRRFLDGFASLDAPLRKSDTLRDLLRKVPEHGELQMLASDCVQYIEAVLYSGTRVEGHSTWIENTRAWEAECRAFALSKNLET